ncbi:MAG TPA: CBS domain-containing protein [Anaerolineaceae bacterium]|nr:CBS domain-containing protein [Anaerolineaceae bacterium]
MAVVTVQQLLENKPDRAILTIAPSASVREALTLMYEKDIGALLVLDERRLVGVFSERDYARKVIEKKEINLDSSVRELMSNPVYFISPSSPVDEAMSLMSDRHIRHLPVMDGGELVGIISIGDVVKQMILEKDSSIQSLEEYIWVNML